MPNGYDKSISPLSLRTAVAGMLLEEFVKSDGNYEEIMAGTLSFRSNSGNNGIYLVAVKHRDESFCQLVMWSGGFDYR